MTTKSEQPPSPPNLIPTTPALPRLSTSSRRRHDEVMLRIEGRSRAAHERALATARKKMGREVASETNETADILHRLGDQGADRLIAVG